MDCLPSGYSFTQDDEKRFKLFFFLIHSLLEHISSNAKREKKSNERREKRKTFSNDQSGREVVVLFLGDNSLLGVFSNV